MRLRRSNCFLSSCKSRGRHTHDFSQGVTVLLESLAQSTDALSISRAELADLAAQQRQIAAKLDALEARQ